MALKHPGARPCSAILSTTVQQKTKITANDSSSIWDCMTWGYEGNVRNLECRHNDGARYQLSQSAQLHADRNMRVKCGCCEDGEYLEANQEYYSERGRYNQTTEQNRGNVRNYQEKQVKGGNTGSYEKPSQTIRNNTTQKPQVARAKSPQFQAQGSTNFNRMEVQQVKKRRLNQLMNKNKEKTLDREKLQDYIESQKAFSRGMSNTQFRNFYGKQCMEAYGRNNTNEPIGGIIYGNNLKTFNINPHSSSNDPKYYQTHNTAINFAKRSKLDEDKSRNMLQKQLGKQLNLKAVNETLILGKDVVYQEVNEDNMYAAMKVNHEFAKNNKDDIRQGQKQFKRNQVLNQWAVQDQYKEQREYEKGLLKNAPLGSTMAASEAEEEFRRTAGTSDERMNRQVIYKLVDSDGNVRYGADRHSITCFVDTNFPENQAAYTAELRNRNPIFPIKVKEGDRHLDEIRKQNYVESVVNNYPAHYLIPNVDMSKVVLRPGADRKRTPGRQKRPQSAHPVTKQTVNNSQNQPAFQNTKVIANINQNRVGSPKAQIRNNTLEKPSYNNQSTKMTLGTTHNHGHNHSHAHNHNNNVNHQLASQSQDYTRYTNTLKNALLNQSTKNPHFATELLVRASQNPNTIPSPNQRLVNEEYDARNYYPHANHEMKPLHHRHIKSTKIPYAGVQSNILDAIH